MEKPEQKELKHNAKETFKEGAGTFYDGVREIRPGKLLGGSLKMLASLPMKGMEIVSGTRKKIKDIGVLNENLQRGADISTERGFSRVDAKLLGTQSSVREKIQMVLKDGKNILSTTVIVPGGKAPCRMERADGSIIDKGAQLRDNEEITAGTQITDPNAFYSFLAGRAKGGGHGFFGTMGRMAKNVGKRASQVLMTATMGVATLGITALGVNSLAGLFGSGVGALSAGNFHTLALATALSANPVLIAAALAALGITGYAMYKTWKETGKIFPEGAKPMYALSKSGSMNMKDLMAALDQKKGVSTFNAKYNITPQAGENGIAKQEGDIILSMPSRVSELNVVVQDPTDPDNYENKFIAPDGTAYDSNKILPAGTRIPHGTLWRNGGSIPAHSKHEVVVSFRDRMLKEADLRAGKSVRIENSCELQANIVLGGATTINVDIEGFPANTNLPVGTVIPKGTKIPAGTVIPGGSHMKQEELMEGDMDLNTTGQETIKSTGWKIEQPTVLRRNITVTEGVDIPNKAGVVDLVYLNNDEKIDRKSLAVNDLPNQVKTSRKGYTRFLPKDHIIHAGTLLPAGTVLPASVTLEPLHTDDYAAGNSVGAFPVGVYLTADTACTKSTDMQKIETELVAPPAGAAPTPTTTKKQLLLEISDDIPQEKNTIDHTFVDPVNKIRIEKGQKIPKGTNIPAEDVNKKKIEIPADLVIPGGSRFYVKEDTATAGAPPSPMPGAPATP